MREEMREENREKNIQARLYSFTMEKKWEEVVKIYEGEPSAHKMKLTKSEDTALHIAISTYNPRRPDEASLIKKMINVVLNLEPSASLNVLSMQDARGETPLHIAAAVHWLQICDTIASKHWQLVGIRNADGETPLFIAAHQGNLQAFLRLRNIYNNGKKDPTQELLKKEKKYPTQAEPDESLCRREDGNTILHSAISGEYFRLAYQIIHMYPKLIDSKNVIGESPLHVLARKPNVFRSSNHLGFYDSIIYKCAIVDDLKQQTNNQREGQNTNSDENDLNKLSGNWRTCLDLYDLGTRLFRTFTGKSSPLCKKHINGESTDEENQRHVKDEDETRDAKDESREHYRLFPPNYTIDILLLKFAMKVILIFLGIGFGRIRMIQDSKKLHTDASKIMKEMIKRESSYKYDYYENTGQQPDHQQLKKEHFGGFKLPDLAPDDYITSSTKNLFTEDKKKLEKKRANVLLVKDSPIIIAAKMGILEMVRKINKTVPIAIRDLDSDGKNLLMVAAEHRQTKVFEYLKSRMPRHMLRQLDNQGNNILHHAAMRGEQLHPWRIPGAALQMQWEIKWYKYVEKNASPLCVGQQNQKGETPNTIFTRTHEDLVKNGSEWLIKTSESCSVVAALIAAVAFATSATVPGGLNQDTGYPILRNQIPFDIFSVASLAALCLSVTALVFFLTIITSRCENRDFAISLPRKLLIGLTSLFASIAAVLLSFCAGHNFVLGQNLRFAALPIYAFAGAPVAIFAIAQLPLYSDLLIASSKEVPIRNYKVF